MKIGYRHGIFKNVPEHEREQFVRSISSWLNKSDSSFILAEHGTGTARSQFVYFTNCAPVVQAQNTTTMSSGTTAPTPLDFTTIQKSVVGSSNQEHAPVTNAYNNIFIRETAGKLLLLLYSLRIFYRQVLCEYMGPNKTPECEHCESSSDGVCYRPESFPANQDHLDEFSTICEDFSDDARRVLVQSTGARKEKFQENPRFEKRTETTGPQSSRNYYRGNFLAHRPKQSTRWFQKD